MKIKILFVDDNKFFSNMLAEQLMAHGFEVLPVFSGQEGLDAFLKDKPNIILLDISMPEMTGLQMLEKLRALPKGNDVPVIMLTNISDVDSTVTAAKFNVKDYIIKTDWKINDLILKIKNLTNSAQ